MATLSYIIDTIRKKINNDDWSFGGYSEYNTNVLNQFLYELSVEELGCDDMSAKYQFCLMADIFEDSHIELYAEVNGEGIYNCTDVICVFKLQGGCYISEVKKTYAFLLKHSDVIEALEYIYMKSAIRDNKKDIAELNKEIKGIEKQNESLKKQMNDIKTKIRKSSENSIKPLFE